MHSTDVTQQAPDATTRAGSTQGGARSRARWRLPFVAAGLAMVIGGPLHPESDPELSLRDELATMTSGDTWVLSHSLLAAGAALLAWGLWTAHRDRSWPASTRRALLAAAVALSLYFVETLFHLAAAVDSDALASGDAAPVAFTHIALSTVLYPVTGSAMVWLGAKQFAAVDLPRKVFGVTAVLAGALHAASVPLTLILPDTELSPVFAGAGMLFAAWGLGTGLTGLAPSSTRGTARRLAGSPDALAKA